MVLRLVWDALRWRDRSAWCCVRLEPCGSGRRLVHRRDLLPGGGPQQPRPDVLVQPRPGFPFRSVPRSVSSRAGVRVPACGRGGNRARMSLCDSCVFGCRSSVILCVRPPPTCLPASPQSPAPPPAPQDYRYTGSPAATPPQTPPLPSGAPAATAQTPAVQKPRMARITRMGTGFVMKQVG